jgi:uncharacterized phage protein gp47/JayE
MALTADGLVIRRYPEILEDLINNLKANVDASIDTSDDTLLGQFIQIIAEAIADGEELDQAVYDAFNLLKAEGKNLDDLGALLGYRRIEERKTQGFLRVTAGNGVVVPSGAIFANPITSDRYLSVTNNTLSSLTCLKAVMTVKNLYNSELYTIDVNGTVYEYTSDVDATALEIITGLKAEIDADSGVPYTATIVDDIELVIETSTVNTIAVSSITYIGVDSVDAEIYIEAEEAGVILAPANTITQIVVGVPSTVVAVTNPLVLTTGNLTESDEVFRNRIINTRALSGTATVESIEAALSAIAGVTDSFLVENDESVEVDGRPPKSYEPIVSGGDNTEIATVLWETKPTGIKIVGNTMVIITRPNGQQRTVYFTRPTSVNVAVQVTYTYYDEESFDLSGGEVTIKQVVADHLNSLGVGVDVIPKRMIGPIYSNVAGLEDIIIEMQTLANSGDAPDGGMWSGDVIEISSTEIASGSTQDVYPVGP